MHIKSIAHRAHSSEDTESRHPFHTYYNSLVGEPRERQGCPKSTLSWGGSHWWQAQVPPWLRVVVSGWGQHAWHRRKARLKRISLRATTSWWGWPPQAQSSGPPLAMIATQTPPLRWKVLSEIFRKTAMWTPVQSSFKYIGDFRFFSVHFGLD